MLIKQKFIVVLEVGFGWELKRDVCYNEIYFIFNVLIMNNIKEKIY